MKTILMTMFWASALLAQQVDGDPAYRYATFSYFPWEEAKAQMCLWKVDIVGTQFVYTKAANVPVTVSAKVQRYSGWHPHPGGNSTPPVPTLIKTDPANGQTNSEGCVTSWWKPTGFSGWATFMASVPITPTSTTAYPPDGENVYFGYYDWDSHGKAMPLVPFTTPGNLYTMDPGRHGDPRHADSAGSHSRYVTPAVSRQMVGIAGWFNLRTGLLLDYVRISLPSGGTADNEVFNSSIDSPYLLPEWGFLNYEKHQMGVEVDISNPSVIYGGTSTMLVEMLEVVGVLFDCRVGARDQNGSTVPPGPYGPGTGPDGFWTHQEVLHMTCRQSPIN